MENKQPLGIGYSSGVNDTPVSPGPAPAPSPTLAPPAKGKNRLFIVISFIILIILLALGITWVITLSSQRSEQSSQFNTTEVDLSDVATSDFKDAEELTIFGQLNIADRFRLAPTTAPTAPKAGHIYYDQASNILQYFNGTEFIELTDTPELAFGSGISNTNNILNNTGVLSLQGQTGDVALTAGSGIIIDGTTISATELGLIDESQVTGEIEAVTAGSGLTGGGTEDSVTLNVTSANGGIVVGGDDIALTLAPVADALSTTTSSGSGLEVLPSGLALLQGCANNEVLKWNEAADVWSCSTDSAGSGSNSFETINTSAGTDPVADGATDTLNLTVTGTNLTVTGDSATDTIDFDLSEAALAGNGLGVSGDALSVNVASGITTSADSIVLDTNFNPTWTADHTWTLSGTENLDITHDLSGTVNMIGLVGTPSASAGTTRGIFLQQAASANTNGLDQGITIDNADNDLAITSALSFTNSGGGNYTNIFDILGTTLTASEVTVLDGGIDESEVTGEIEAVTAGAGLTGGGAAGSVTLDIASGNAAVVINANDITLTVSASQDGLSGNLTSGSGLEVNANGLSLLQGCANDDILKWNETTDLWTCSADSGTNTISFSTINAPSGTDPVADGANDTLNLTATGANLTITGDSTTDTIDLDISEATLAGNGLGVSGDALIINTGNGLEISGDAVRVNQDFAFTWSTDHDFSLAGTENINFTNTTGSNAVDMLALTLTNNDAGAAAQRGIAITNADSTSTTEALIALDNADTTASSLTDGIIITSSGVNNGITDAIDVSAANITNAINIGANAIAGTNFSVDTSGIITTGTLGSADNVVYLCRNSSNQIASCSASGAGVAFINGGNSFGGTATLGTNDNFGLNFEVNGGNVATIANTGAVNFVNNADSTSAFNVETLAGGNLLTVDTSNSRVGVSLGANNTPTLAAGISGLEVSGAIRVSGTTANYDTYATPLGGNIDARLSFVNDDVDATDQIIALGLTAASNSTARGISVLDARAGAHQPSIAVISPDQAQIGGFSWDGSDTAFLIKNTASGSVGLNVAGTTRVSATTTGADVTGLLTVSSLGTADSATYLCRNTSNQLATCNTTGAGAAFTQGGNSFGAAGDLGTNDGNALNFRTNNATRITISTTGSLTWAGGSAGNFDHSASSGAFSTGSGLVTLNGSTTVSAADTFTVTSGLTSLTGATSGDALNVSNSTSTGNIAVFSDNATAVATIANGGATTFQNQTNSASALAVLNTSSGEILGVDTVDSMLRLLANSSGHLQSFTSDIDLPSARDGFSLLSSGGNLLMFGGCDTTGTATATVQRTVVRNIGSVGAWSNTASSLPTASCNNAAAMYNGYVYVSGGTGAVGTSDDIYFAKVGPDGDIASWNTAGTQMPAAIAHHSMVAYNGYLYVIGGRTTAGSNLRDVSYAPIYANGALGSFTTQSNWLPAVRLNHSSVVANNRLYVTGGRSDLTASEENEVYIATMGENGALASASTDADLIPASRYNHASVILNGYLYVMGGDGGGAINDDIYYAPINNDSTIDAFSTDTTLLPGNRSAGDAVVINGYVFFVGGDNGSDEQDNVWSSSGPRVTIGGSLDLIGYSGNSLSSGGTGGELTAGNTHIAGTLTVTGNTSFMDGVSILNNFTIHPKVDSTGVFTIVNSSNISHLSVDTTNSRVYIGNPTADTTGAILVLDTKTSAGDPTGVDGAMYYNSSTDRMRCYEQSRWTNCTSASQEYDVMDIADDFASGGATNGTIGSQGWALIGAAATLAAQVGEQGHPGIVELGSGATSGNIGSIMILNTGSGSITAGDVNYFGAIVRPVVGTSSMSTRVGILNSGVASGEASQGVYFSFLPGTSANWRTVTRNGATGSDITTNTSSTAYTLATWYRLEIKKNDSGNWEFYIDGTLQFTHSTDIPAGSLTTNPAVTIETNTNATRTIDVDWARFRSDIISRS